MNSSTDRINKLTSREEMAAACRHNYSTPDEGLREDLVVCTCGCKDGMYQVPFLSRMMQNPDYSPRKNQTLAFDVYLKYQESEDMPYETWKIKAAEWMKDRFNVVWKGEANVIHAAVHEEASGAAHIHAFVVPVDPRGKLSAGYFTGGKSGTDTLLGSYSRTIERERKINRAEIIDEHDWTQYYLYAIGTVVQEKGESARKYSRRLADTANILYVHGIFAARRLGKDASEYIACVQAACDRYCIDFPTASPSEREFVFKTAAEKMRMI